MRRVITGRRNSHGGITPVVKESLTTGGLIFVLARKGNNDGTLNSIPTGMKIKGFDFETFDRLVYLGQVNASVRERIRPVAVSEVQPYRPA